MAKMSPGEEWVVDASGCDPSSLSSGETLEALFNAMIEAWPGMDIQSEDWERWKLPFPLIILPLPQEPADAE